MTQSPQFNIEMSSIGREVLDRSIGRWPTSVLVYPLKLWGSMSDSHAMEQHTIMFVATADGNPKDGVLETKAELLPIFTLKCIKIDTCLNTHNYNILICCVQ